jgi:hypothetical protein
MSITVLTSTESGADSLIDINANFADLDTTKADGAASSTDNAIARFDGITGKVIQDSALTITDITSNAINIQPPSVAGTGTTVRFIAGDAASGDNNGGNLILRAGAKSGTGTDGTIRLQVPNPSVSAVLNISGVTSTDKTFTFPNETGTFAVGTPWTTWNPTFANFTKGSATIVARYTMIGKTVTFLLKVTLAADSSMGTEPTFTLPVTASDSWAASIVPLGNCIFNDSGTAAFVGISKFVNSTTAMVDALVTSGTYQTRGQVTSSAPMTWTTSDSFTVTGTYEAA